MNPHEVDINAVDTIDFLRAEGEMVAKMKQDKAALEKETEFREKHTFAPNVNRKRKPRAAEPEQRPSIGSINLDGIAKHRNNDEPRPKAEEIV